MTDTSATTHPASDHAGLHPIRALMDWFSRRRDTLLDQMEARRIAEDLGISVDDLMRHPTDQPTIGLILCKTKERIKAEYALRDINKPIGVAEWQTKLVESLPEPLKGILPSIEEIEAEFESEDLP